MFARWDWLLPNTKVRCSTKTSALEGACGAKCLGTRTMCPEGTVADRELQKSNCQTWVPVVLEGCCTNQEASHPLGNEISLFFEANKTLFLKLVLRIAFLKFKNRFKNTVVVNFFSFFGTQNWVSVLKLENRGFGDGLKYAFAVQSSDPQKVSVLV